MKRDGLKEATDRIASKPGRVNILSELLEKFLFLLNANLV
jgi:hypothetical protein